MRAVPRLPFVVLLLACGTPRRHDMVFPVRFAHDATGLVEARMDGRVAVRSAPGASFDAVDPARWP